MLAGKAIFVMLLHFIKAALRISVSVSGKGRLMIRASGTEPKIRVMVESKDEALNREVAAALVATIEKINGEKA